MPEMSIDLKERIVAWYFEDQYSYRQIAALANCSIGHISNVLHTYREYGQVKNPFSCRTGRPSEVNEGDITYIHSLLEANPTLYLDELQDRLLSVRNIHVSIATVSRILTNYAMTRKRLRRVAGERDEELRGIWEADMAQYENADVFVALDESAVDDRVIQRRFGRSLAGTPCVRRGTFLRGTRYSILPALTTDGIIALDIFEGSVTKDRFLAFIREQVVCIKWPWIVDPLTDIPKAPQLNPFPSKRSVVILDNCSIHHDEELRNIIVDQCGARLVYLPPYSPDFNPIEEAFSAIKAWLRRHESRYTSAEVLPWMIHQASLHISKDDALGWFGDCGYL